MNIGIIGGIVGTITLGDDPTEHTVHDLTALELVELPELLARLESVPDKKDVLRLIEIVSRMVPSLSDVCDRMSLPQLVAIAAKPVSAVSEVEALFPNGSGPSPATGPA
jgi:hypothetical protein